jgi:hypothetical protein
VPPQSLIDKEDGVWQKIPASATEFTVIGRAGLPFGWSLSILPVGWIGWRWTNNAMGGGACEIQWIDPEPKEKDRIIALYRMLLLREDQQKYLKFYRGLRNPPTQVEYARRAREISLDSVLAKATMIPTNWAVL